MARSTMECSESSPDRPENTPETVADIPVTVPDDSDAVPEQDQRYDSPYYQQGGVTTPRGNNDWRGSWRANWRADYVLIIWSLPLVLAFIPHLRPDIKDGFEILRSDVPPWYVQIGGIMVAGIYGFRKIFNLSELYLKTKLANSDKDNDD